MLSKTYKYSLARSLAIFHSFTEFSRGHQISNTSHLLNTVLVGHTVRIERSIGIEHTNGHQVLNTSYSTY